MSAVEKEGLQAARDLLEKLVVPPMTDDDLEEASVFDAIGHLEAASSKLRLCDGIVQPPGPDPSYWDLCDQIDEIAQSLRERHFDLHGDGPVNQVRELRAALQAEEEAQRLTNTSDDTTAIMAATKRADDLRRAALSRTR